MRPDFGSRPARPGLRARQRRALAATTQMLSRARCSSTSSHLIAVRSVDVENDDARAAVAVRYVVLRDRTRRHRRPSRLRGAGHEISLLRPAPSRAWSSDAGTANGIEFLEVLDSTRRPARRGSRPCSSSCSQRRPPRLRRTISRIAGGERIRDHRHRLVRAGRLRCRRRPRPGLVAGRRSSGHHPCRPHRRQRRLSRPTRCSLVAAPGSDAAAGRLRSAARRRSTSRSRSNARPTSTARTPCVCPPEPRRAARTSTISPRTIRRFRRLMLDRLSLLVPGWTERIAGRSRRHPGRAARLCRRQSCPIARTPSPTRPISPPRASAVSVRRHARLVDYRDARGLQRPRLRPFRAGRRPECRAAQGDAAAHPRPGPRQRGGRRPEQPRTRRCAGAGALGLRDRVAPRRSTSRPTSFAFYTWGDEACCLPARQHPRHAARRASFAQAGGIAPNRS